MAVDTFEKRLFVGLLYGKLKEVVAEFDAEIAKASESFHSISATEQSDFVGEIFDESCVLVR